ncbi:DUF6300 family protein [Streptomyces massasporeus]
MTTSLVSRGFSHLLYEREPSGSTSHTPTSQRQRRRTPPFASCRSGADGRTERPCSRCGGDLLLHWHGLLVTGVWMELRPACDAYRPAARALIRGYRDTDLDPKALPQLFEDWETETMHAHGWARAPRLAPPDGPTPPSALTPRGRN